jgi:hypothetical protein
MKHRALLPALVVPLLALGACGGTTVARDPGPSAAPTSGSVSSSPSSSPTTGTYPHYQPTDYGFDLVVSCFCADSDTPIRVTVLHAKVVGAVYLGDATGRGSVHAGETADQNRWLSINDVIDAANDTSAYRVTVDWPAGQDYPNRVVVDPNQNTTDEGVGYAISDVEPAG